MTENATIPSRFLALPAELRDQIYIHALTEPSNLGVGGSYKTSPTSPWVFGGDVSKQAFPPALTRTCRQIRWEALPLFYSLNRFTLAVHYRRSRAEVAGWINLASRCAVVKKNLRHVTVKHRFGILDFKGTIDFDLNRFEILGPKLWFNSIPPLISREVEEVVASAREAEQDDNGDLAVQTLQRLVDILGVNVV